MGLHGRPDGGNVDQRVTACVHICVCVCVEMEDDPNEQGKTNSDYQSTLYDPPPTDKKKRKKRLCDRDRNHRTFFLSSDPNPTAGCQDDTGSTRCGHTRTRITTLSCGPPPCPRDRHRIFTPLRSGPRQRRRIRRPRTITTRNQSFVRDRQPRR